MTTATPRMTSSKKLVYILPSNFTICLVCRLVKKLTLTEYVMLEINSKRKYGNQPSWLTFSKIQYCARVMQVNFYKIPGFSRKFRLKQYFADFLPQFRDAYCFNSREFSNNNLLSRKFVTNFRTIIRPSQKFAVNFQAIICSSQKFAVNFQVHICSVYHLPKRFHQKSSSDYVNILFVVPA